MNTIRFIEQQDLTWFKHSTIPCWHDFMCHSQLIQIANRKEILLKFTMQANECDNMDWASIEWYGENRTRHAYVK